MKILIASDLYWPGINGVATFSRNLARGLAERGNEVMVVAPSQTGKKYSERDGDYTIARTVSIPFWPVNGSRVSVSPYLEVRKVVKEFKPDIIHTQTPLSVGLAALQVGARYGIPMVSTTHGMTENLTENIPYLTPVARPMTYLLKEYVRLIHRNISYMTLPTQSAIDMYRDTAQKVNFPVEAVSNGIDLKRFVPKKVPSRFYERFGIPEDKRIVFYLGRLDAEKHLSVLVKAFAHVVRQRRDTHLLIVGAGNDADNLRELARNLDIVRSVTFTGRVSDEDLPVLDRVGSVYCMTSPAELQCIAMLEAMASGLPVVSIDAGPLKELCQDGRNGYLTKVDDDQDMAQKILLILSDEEKRQAMGRESLAIARTHDLTHTLDRYEQIYRQVIAKPRRVKKRRIASLMLRKPR